MKKVDLMKNYKISFYLKKSKPLQNGQFPIYIRLKIGDQVAEMGVRSSIHLEDWDSESARHFGKSRSAIDLNNQLEELEDEIRYRYRDYVKNGEEFLAKDLLGKKSKTHQKVKNYTLLDLIGERDQALKELVDAGVRSNGTKVRHDTALKHITGFLQHEYGKSDISIGSVDPHFISSFDHYLRVVANHQTNTVSKHMKSLKQVTGDALKRDILKKDPFVNYTIRQEKTQREILTMQEVDRLRMTEFECKKLELTRDLFLFQIYTGLAYLDLNGISKEHLIRKSDTDYWISMKRGKSNVHFDVPLMPIPLQLIEKYKISQEITGKIFPVKSNQKINADLKQIGVLAGISKVLTSHIARHTFATTITLENGVPIETISRVLGHTKIQTTQIYAKASNIKIQNDFATLNERLSL